MYGAKAVVHSINVLASVTWLVMYVFLSTSFLQSMRHCKPRDIAEAGLPIAQPSGVYGVEMKGMDTVDASSAVNN